MHDSLITELLPAGRLRVALNMSNFLLVNGETDTGEPDGVSPDMARAIAASLGVGVEFLCYKGPGDVADAAASQVWDIGNIAAEPERARTICFSPAYCEIQACYLLPPGSTLDTLAAVDQPGIRIAVKNRAAYDLWLTENLHHASLERADSLDASFELFVDQQLDVLAGLRPKLLQDKEKLPGSRLMDESFTAVQQSIGCQPDKPAAAEFLARFVEDSISNGLVESLISKHGVTGRLSVASLSG